MTTRDLVPRQEETYNRLNWAYKIRDLAACPSSGTGGIFATCNCAARCTFARRCWLRAEGQAALTATNPQM
jgi:hypothetical protein